MRGSAARSRLAKEIFSFLTKPDDCAKRALLERRPFVRKLARKKSLLNARRQRSAYAPSSSPCDYGQSLRASRRNTSLRSGSCSSAEHEPRKSRAVPAHGGVKRGMPVASPGVARRAERGPWTRSCTYFDLYGNSKLLRAVTPSVSCADSFPKGDASLLRARRRWPEGPEEVHGRTGKDNT